MMIAYAQYYNDARIQSYVHAWLDRGARVDVFCLRDPVPAPNDSGRLAVHGWLEKYQGGSALRYLISYVRFFVGTRRRVRALLRRYRYDVVHVHNMPDALVFCVPGAGGRALRRYGVLILDMHDVMPAAALAKFTGWRRRFWYQMVWWQTKASAQRADLVIHADHAQMELLTEYGISPPRRMVYLNLPDPRWFRERAPRPPGRPVRLVYHGSITRRSGLDLALEVVGNLAEHCDVTLTLIGDGELRPALEARSEALRWKGSRIHFKDFLPVERLQAELEQYDIGIIANRRSLMSERCMLPVKLMEYVKIGLPVVAPRLAVIRRYFDEDMVQYFEPDHAADLERALRELVEHPEGWPAQVARARRFFDTYSVARQQEQYFQAIEELLAVKS